LVEEGLFYKNKREKIDGKYVRLLYERARKSAETDGKTASHAEVFKEMPDELSFHRRDGGGERESDIYISPSGLERYGRCPFSHFVFYGLSPKEKRIVEIGGRERGDLFHRLLMNFSKALTKSGVEITAQRSPWMELTREESDALVTSLLDDLLENPETAAIFRRGRAEEYRAARILELAKEAAWAVAEQVKAGAIREMYFEERFGADRRFPAIAENLKGGGRVLIEGQIDRIDILRGGRAKILDYKSGNEKFNVDEARNGWRLQLMLYMRAVAGPVLADAEGMERNADADERDERERLKPAGVFYFIIGEPQLNCVDWSDAPGAERREKIAREIRKSFKLDGIAVDDQDALKSIAGTDYGGKHYEKGHSDIISVRAKADKETGEIVLAGNTALSRKIMAAAEFAGLQRDVEEKLSEFCSSLANGVIYVDPKRTKLMTACKFCDYRGICCYDIQFAE
jgi:ATP-dependent helicase/nuclease subunit B